MNGIASILYFVASTVLLAMGLSCGGKAFTPNLAAIALGGGALVGLAMWWMGRRAAGRLRRPRGWEWVPVLLYTLFALRSFLWLVWRQGDELMVLSPNNLGDLSLHLSFIEYFRSGVAFWPESPIFHGGKLAYAAGMDIFNALLAVVGVDPLRGLVGVGLVGAILSGLALWRWGGGFTLMGFLCLGGLLGFAAFQDNPFFQDYAGLMKFDWAWKSLPLALLVTQRGLLFALPAGLLLLSSWRTRFFPPNQENEGRLPFLGELLLYAAMPIFHLHTFLVLSFLLAVVFICQAQARWKIATFVGMALVPATVLVFFTTGMGQANPLPMWTNMSDVEHPPGRPISQVLGWQPGWMVNEPTQWDAWTAVAGDRLPALEPHGRFLAFWLGNFGLWPFVAGALVVGLLRKLSHRPLPASTVWWAALAFVVITPLLGQWAGFSRDSFTQLLFGRGLGPIARCAIPGGVALGSLLCGGLITGQSPAARALRLGVVTFAVLVAIDGALVAISQAGVPVPLLPASAMPLLLATAAFIAVLLRTARAEVAVRRPAVFGFSALFLFFVCCNVKFAPWAWDNTKLMIWAVLLVMPFLWEHVLKPHWRGTRALACGLLFFSGCVGLLGALGSHENGYPLARFSEIDLTRAALNSVPQTEAIACAPTYKHPILLGGRKVALGYLGHLDSHGLAYRDRAQLLNTLMAGETEWRFAAAKLGVRYLWWGSLEEERWPDSTRMWRGAVKRVMSTPIGELYDLEMPRVPLEGQD